MKAHREGLFEVEAVEAIPDESIANKPQAIKRTLSDLELSSFVRKTEVQVKKRDKRVF